MQRKHILVVFATLLNLSAAKADALRDSIGVENANGKKIILHQVVAKDTYYSISRRYGIGPKIIMSYNNEKYLSIGVIVKVPTEIPFNTPVDRSAKNRPESNTTPVNQSAKNPPENNASPTEENGNLIEYSVQKKDNLNLLANRYGTTVDEIKRVNGLRSINLQIGQLLKIPAKQESTAETTSETPLTTSTAPPASNPSMVSKNNTEPAQQSATQYKKPETAKQEMPLAKKTETPKLETPIAKKAIEDKPAEEVNKVAEAVNAADNSRDKLIVHTVAGNETMYSISSKYNLTMDQLKAKNNLTTNSLYVGQRLLISGQYPVKQDTYLGDNDNETDTLDNVRNPSLRLPPSRYGLSQMDEKGTGIWIMDPDLDSSKMLVLHRTAPVGTIMKITNPMTNRSTFAKVIGKFTENESTKDTIIVMTKAVADALGALDKRFLCNLTYSGQANEQ